MLAVNHSCQSFSYQTLSFLKSTHDCSAAVFTWFDHVSEIPTHFSDGFDEKLIQNYYSKYVENDPINHLELIKTNARTARLTPDLLGLSHTEKYQDFMSDSAFKDEADIILWAADAPIASIALIKLNDDCPFKYDLNIEKTRQFIQSNFDLLPSIKKMNLQSHLKNALHFTAKESLIATLLCEGYANKEIAMRLNIEAATVKTHLINIFEKLEVKSRTQAVSIMTTL